MKNYRALYPHFEVSLRRHGFSESTYEAHYNNLETKDLPRYVHDMRVLEQSYERDRLKNCVVTKSYKIPRIIHQIWLGSPVPEKYKQWMDIWKNFQGWEYRLWTEKEVATLSLHNKKLYEAAQNYGERSDILRYEILHTYGGVYVDADEECLDPEYFEFAHREYSFYCGLEPLEWWKPLLIANSILASIPGHPLMWKLIVDMQDNWDVFERTRQVPYGNHSKIADTISKTGPFYVTREIFDNWILLGHDGIVLPPTFFFPILRSEIPEKERYLFEETVAIQHWHATWLTEKGAVRKNP